MERANRPSQPSGGPASSSRAQPSSGPVPLRAPLSLTPQPHMSAPTPHVSVVSPRVNLAPAMEASGRRSKAHQSEPLRPRSPSPSTSTNTPARPLSFAPIISLSTPPGRSQTTASARHRRRQEAPFPVNSGDHRTPFCFLSPPFDLALHFDTVW